MRLVVRKMWFKRKKVEVMEEKLKAASHGGRIPSQEFTKGTEYISAGFWENKQKVGRIKLNIDTDTSFLSSCVKHCPLC